MRNLILMRHAKAEPASSGGDHGRPLSPRGRDEATEAGTRLAALATPDLALASDSLRTRETLDRLLPALAKTPSCRVTRGLYAATAETMLAEIAAAPDDVETLLIVGHNPGTADLARRLATTGEPALLARLAEGFPTSCFVVIASAADRWAEAARGGRAAFLLPRGERRGAPGRRG